MLTQPCHFASLQLISSADDKGPFLTGHTARRKSSECAQHEPCL